MQNKAVFTVWITVNLIQYTDCSSKNKNMQTDSNTSALGRYPKEKVPETDLKMHRHKYSG